MLRFSTAFEDGQTIPGTYTCDGADTPLPIDIETAPDGTEAFVLYFEDPDSDDAPFLHWLVTNIPADGRIGEGEEQTNDFGGHGYGGPCPRQGAHRYVLTLYALSDRIRGDTPRTSERFEDTYRRIILDSATIEGTYSRSSASSQKPRER